MKIIAILLILLFTVCCYQIYTNPGNEKITSEIIHKYKIFIVDEENNKPLANVVVNYEISEEKRTLIKKKITTDETGIILDSVIVQEIYGSSLSYEAELNGYCKKIGKIRRNIRAVSEVENNEYYIIMKKPEITSHVYRVKVVGLNNKPIEGINVEYTIFSASNNKKFGTSFTNLFGNFIDSLEIISCEQDFTSTMQLNLSKNNYYSKDTVLEFISKNEVTKSLEILDNGFKLAEDYDNEIAVILTLYSPYDFFKESFLQSKLTVNLRKNILDFLNLLILQSYLNNAFLEYHSINLQSFKGKKYLQFEFNTIDIFNSLKLNKYDIGGQIFDDIIRKNLNPLNDYLASTSDLYGFDLVVKAYHKNFLNENEVPKTIKYEFFIPKEIVKKYKAKDISGQNVLDSSIILLDDERIELKLQ